MAKSLVIVESPAKVKTIHKFLGKDFIVKSSVGHIRDLAKSPPKGKKAKGAKTKVKKSSLTAKERKQLEQDKLVVQMGVNPYDHWKASYAILPGKEKVLQSLQEAALKAKDIYLATDIDREGEAIAWHLMEAIGGDKSRFKRVTFTEITKKAIKEAFLAPSTLNYDRVHAQQARRFLDRVVGYMLSPLLWKKVARGLSAGRVQSIAVRLIAERERAIYAFKPEEYWEVRTKLFNKAQEPFFAELSKFKGETFTAKNETEAMQAVEVLRKSKYLVKEVDKKPTTSRPSAPFITSTLQQAASVRLGYGVKKTMVLAQRLYEHGFITYMRTDSTNLSEEAVSNCRTYIKDNFGDKYLPSEPVKYSSKKSAQEAHEAIRPTDLHVKSEDLSGEDHDAVKLYDLIWRQFLACQMSPAIFDSTGVQIQCGDYELRARGRILRFDGFLKVQPLTKKSGEEDNNLPVIEKGEQANLGEVIPSQHFTKPPARFTEASLVRELEKKGIGRPSTYAAIISTIQDRGYAKVEKKRFFCMKMGELVTDRLVENFTDLMDFDFTANLEEDLDKIARGEADWRKILDQFYAHFSKTLDQATKKMQSNEPTHTDIKCPTCGRNMNIRIARTGVFLSCEGYALEGADRCKGTLNLIPGEEMESYGDEESEEGSVEELHSKKRCPICDTIMNAFYIDEHRKLHICGNNPQCPGFLVEEGKFRVRGYDGPTIVCDKCQSPMVLKSGRFGKYYACSNTNECHNTRKVLRNGEAAPPHSKPVPMPELKCEKSSGHFVLRDGAAGVFLASSDFPASKETKRPQVSDLKRHKDELDPKYVFLTEAPEKDPDGNPAIIRFSRKTKQHFIMSEKDEKPTGWSLSWQDGKWVSDQN